MAKIQDRAAAIEAAIRDATGRLEMVRQSVPANWGENIAALIQTTAGRAQEKLTLGHLTQPGNAPTNSVGLHKLTGFEALCLMDPEKVSAYLTAAGQKYIAGANASILPNKDRIDLEAEIESETLKLHRQREALIDEAELADIIIDRKTDPDPRAFFGLPDRPGIAWDFFSEKLEALETEAAAASSILQTRRQILVDARDEMKRAQREGEGYSSPHNPMPGNLKREIDSVKAKVDRAQAGYLTALEDANKKRLLPGLMRNWLEANRQPKPPTFLIGN